MCEFEFPKYAVHGLITLVVFTISGPLWKHVLTVYHYYIR